MKQQKIVVVGGGVAGFCAVTKLVDSGYPGELITVIDKGKDTHTRLPEEVMCGGLGCGLWSDGKLTYHHEIGGQLSKYCGKEKAYDLMDQVIQMVTRFHPEPSKIMKSDPVAEPDFIKPYFGLRLFPVYHIGTDYLHEIGKRWYDYLLDKGVKFAWNTEVIDILVDEGWVITKQPVSTWIDSREMKHEEFRTVYDTLIFAVGKSGIDFAQSLSDKYKLPTEPKSVQIGVRFEAPQKYFQKLIDVSYDFKLYQKYENVSLRSFCTNNNAAYVAVEETYGDITYNGHAKKGEQFRNDMTNFGILMEIKGIDNPFEWSRKVVNECNIFDGQTKENLGGIYYSPNQTRQPSNTSEGEIVKSHQAHEQVLPLVRKIFGGYFEHIENFIDQMNKVFEFGDDWGIYIPECKYLSPEPLVNYTNLALTEYPNVHFVGDALSARGITVSGAQGIYVSEYLLSNTSND